MKASLFYLPSIGSRAEIEAGMAGMNPDFYQRMLKELSEQIRLGDELGYDSVSFTEHHFHIEGFELSNNPVLLDLYFAMQTKRIRVGQLGIVLPASNPIRVAEDIAMLDHMTGGRANAGFARGYQRRWVDVMAQQTHGIHGALPNQHDEIDNANRLAFEENFRIICEDEKLDIRESDQKDKEFGWVFEPDRQIALLKNFWGKLEKDKSLIFFYCNHGNPLDESLNRILLGVSRISQIGPQLYFGKKPPKFPGDSTSRLPGSTSLGRPHRISPATKTRETSLFVRTRLAQRLSLCSYDSGECRSILPAHGG